MRASVSIRWRLLVLAAMSFGADAASVIGVSSASARGDDVIALSEVCLDSYGMGSRQCASTDLVRAARSDVGNAVVSAAVYVRPVLVPGSEGVVVTDALGGAVLATAGAACLVLEFSSSSSTVVSLRSSCAMPLPALCCGVRPDALFANSFE